MGRYDKIRYATSDGTWHQPLSIRVFKDSSSYVDLGYDDGDNQNQIYQADTLRKILLTKRYTQVPGTTYCNGRYQLAPWVGNGFSINPYIRDIRISLWIRKTAPGDIQFLWTGRGTPENPAYGGNGYPQGNILSEFTWLDDGRIRYRSDSRFTNAGVTKENVFGYTSNAVGLNQWVRLEFVKYKRQPNLAYLIFDGVQTDLSTKENTEWGTSRCSTFIGSVNGGVQIKDTVKFQGSEAYYEENVSTCDPSASGTRTAIPRYQESTTIVDWI